jgi:DNA-binding LacI/PurR family transcriptional regulator
VVDRVPTPVRRRRAPTIRDVARHADVGVGTVSRVLNDSPRVSAGTQDRVREAIAALGYRRSSTARNLALGRSHAIGVVAPFFTSASVTERLRGVVGRLSERGYDVVLFAVETLRQRADAFGDFARHDRLDGLIVISLPLADHEVQALRADGMPVVLVDVGHPLLAHVLIDNVAGGELATEHLLAKGHRRIGFVGDTPSGPFGFTSSERRHEGYGRALDRAGIALSPELQRYSAFGRNEARALGDALLRLDEPPTAIFAASDVQAIGILQAARELGRRVPEDVAVIGFDDIEMAAALELTTVRQPLLQTGARGADLLLAALESGDDRPVEEFQPLVVVERRTT